MTRLHPYLAGIVLLAAGRLFAQSPYTSSEEFAQYAMKLREAALSQIEPRVVAPTTARATAGQFSWKTDIVTTVFWCGESASANNPVSNRSSSWDLDWAGSYGGYDNPDPAARREFHPINFIPRQNPFYCALPYNDVTHGTTKPEARQRIPWFKEAFVREGQSVCQNHWVAIRNRRAGKTAFAQWSDCGPFSTDSDSYVFGPDRPKPNLNSGAGLDVSPAVRDYLGLANTDVTDWRFVNVSEIPVGPWRRFGDNNQFVQAEQRLRSQVASTATPAPAKPPSDEPKVTTKIPH
jgi:hypothetical protein